MLSAESLTLSFTITRVECEMNIINRRSHDVVLLLSLLRSSLLLSFVVLDSCGSLQFRHRHSQLLNLTLTQTLSSNRRSSRQDQLLLDLSWRTV